VTILRHNLRQIALVSSICADNNNDDLDEGLKGDCRAVVWKVNLHPGMDTVGHFWDCPGERMAHRHIFIIGGIMGILVEILGITFPFIFLFLYVRHRVNKEDKYLAHKDYYEALEELDKDIY
jgi:hypothetical protein